MIQRNNFVLLVQTGALTFDRKYNKTLAPNLVNLALHIPDTLFTEKEYSEYNYVCDLLDFEYGVFDANNEEYPTWIKHYFEWKKAKSF